MSKRADNKQLFTDVRLTNGVKLTTVIANMFLYIIFVCSVAFILWIYRPFIESERGVLLTDPSISSHLIVMHLKDKVEPSSKFYNLLLDGSLVSFYADDKLITRRIVCKENQLLSVNNKAEMFCDKSKIIQFANLYRNDFDTFSAHIHKNQVFVAADFLNKHTKYPFALINIKDIVAVEKMSHKVS